MIESLDDIDAILVYADELMSRGDPHGTLIALQHGKKTRQATAWLQQHAKAILGGLAGNKHVEVKWQHGFIRSASLSDWETEGPSFEVQYDQLRASPAAQWIHELSLGQAPMDKAACTSKQGYCYEALLAMMAKYPLSTLRKLDVGGEVNKPEYNCAVGLAAVLKKHPGLEELGVNGGVYDLGSLPNLRKLRILANHSAANVIQLATAKLPALVELELAGDAYEDHEPSVRDFTALFATKHMPALRRLEFSVNDDELYLEVCRALFASPLLKQLDHLALDFIDNAIADLVLADPAPLRHLKKLALGTLERGDVSVARRKQLKKALPKLAEPKS